MSEQEPYGQNQYQQPQQQYIPQGQYGARQDGYAAPGPQGPYPPPQPMPSAPKAKKSQWRKVAGVLGTIVLAVAILLVVRAVGDHVSGSGGTCTSDSCIVQDLQQDLTGLTAKDDLVSTGAVCQQSTVKDDGNGIYAATCTVTYSDGSTAAGTGTLEIKQGQVSFSPSLP